MRPLLSLTFTISLAFTILITLMRVTFTTRGEIAFENNLTDHVNIYVIDIQTGITHNLTQSQTDEYTPAWSPDGSQIAFVSDQDGDKQSEIYIMNADGSRLRRLSKSVGIYRDPIWTSDGTSLILNHGWKQIYQLNVANSSESWLGIGFAPHLSPDDKQILYYDDASATEINAHIFLLSLTSHVIRDLTAGPTHNWGGTWSPDGKKIIFASSRGGKTEIYSMDADGSNLHAITDGTNDTSAAWSPDGTQIVYAGGNNGSRQLYMVNADGSNKRQLTYDAGDHHAPAWRP